MKLIFQKYLNYTMLVFASLSFSYLAHADYFQYDSCQQILRDGIKDELASNSSKKHRLVRHHQFCSIAKKHNLSTSNFDQFSKAYVQQVESSNKSTDAGASGSYIGVFSAEADYSSSNVNSSMSESEKVEWLKKNSHQVMDYFSTNCGNSSYEEQLETEANLMTRIASSVIVNNWRECMVEKNGVFAYPIFQDEDMLLFSVRVEYKAKGAHYIKNLAMEWFGDNLDTITDDENIFRKTGNGRRADELLAPIRVIYSGANIEIPLKREDNKRNDLVWIHTITDDELTASFSFKLPKVLGLDLKMVSVNPSQERLCLKLQKRALLAGAITYREYENYVSSNLVPIPQADDDWENTLEVSCREINHMNNKK